MNHSPIRASLDQRLALKDTGSMERIQWADGFEDCTFASRVSLVKKDHAAEKVRLVDHTPYCILEDLLVPDVLPPSI